MSATPISPSVSPPNDSVNVAVRREVTVVMAAWRAAGTIGRAVASALAQPEAAEVVVVDDASDDGGATLAAARAADDGSGRLIILALEKNSGPSAARNAAIAASKAPWITILDSDDYFEPGRLRGLMALADQGYDLIADDLMQVKEGAPREAAKAMWFSNKEPRAFDVDFTYFIRSSLPQAHGQHREIGFIKPLIRRAFLDIHAIRYDERMRLGEDFDLYARALVAGGRMRLVPWTGYISVVRERSLSTRHSRQDLVELDAANSRLLEAKSVSAEDAKLVREHGRIVQRKIGWIDITDALKKANIFRVASVVLNDPRQAPHYAGLFAGLVVFKLKGGKWQK